MRRHTDEDHSRRLHRAPRKRPGELTVTKTLAHLRALGLTARHREGEWRVNLPAPEGTEATAYYTTDALDALQTGVAMLKREQWLAEYHSQELHTACKGVRQWEPNSTNVPPR